MRMWPYLHAYSLADFLEAHFGDALPLHWLGGDRADAGPDYCRKCADAAVDAGKGEFVDGGWGGQECDSIPYCEGCGAALSGWLTDYGAAEELRHYRTQQFIAPVNRYTAFHLSRLVWAKPHDEEVLMIAERAAVEILRMQP